MKNFIRLLFISSIILIVSGCKAEYTMDIKSDLRIEEDIKILENNSLLYSVAPGDLNLYITNNINSVRNQGLIKGRYVEVVNQNDSSGARSLYVYNDFNGFQNDNILLNQFYKSITMTINGSLIYLNFDSIDKPYPSLHVVAADDITGTLLTNFTLNIKVPYAVITSNADKVDKIKNLYTWNYDSSTLYKDIKLVFDRNKVFEAKINDVVNKAYKEGKLDTIIMIGIPLGIIVCIIVFFVIRNHRRNKV